MTIRTISALIPASLVALTILASQAPAFAEDASADPAIEQADSSAATAQTSTAQQSTYDPVEESLGD